MGRAIAVLSNSASAMLPRPFASLGRALAALWHEMSRELTRPYRPERHYMRGPGPAFRAKFGQTPRA